MGIKKKLKILSPWTHEYSEYEWPLEVSNNKKLAANEIIDIIRFISEEYLTNFNIGVEKKTLDSVNISSYDNMKCLVDRYNKSIKDVKHLSIGPLLHKFSKENDKSPIKDSILHFVLQLCYNYSVKDPQRLNKFYEPFSPEVYGETSHFFVQQMANQFKLKENDVFIDLGSGVGQVVMHVSAIAPCRCIGIEKADLPAQYAKSMDRRFRFYMKWFGRTHGVYDLHKGDFFDKEFLETITSASFIFVNNFAFGPEVDHRLKSIFENLPDGTRILSSKAFCALNFRISNRNLSDIGAIMRIGEVKPMDQQSVSWTGKPVTYFWHIIDRTAMEKYFMERNKESREKRNAKVNRKQHKKEECDNSSVTDLTSPRSDKSSNETNENFFCKKNHLSAVVKKSSRGRPKKGSTPDKIDIEVKMEITPEKESVIVPQSVIPEFEEASIVDEQTRIEHHNEQPHLQSTKDETKSNETTAEAIASAKRRGRPRKASKKGITKRKTRRLNVNLDILHKHTMLSIDVHKSPPPGCVEHKLCSMEENRDSLPRVLLNDGVTLPGVDEEMSSPAISVSSIENCAPIVSNPNGVKLYDLHSKSDLFNVFEYTMARHVEYSNSHKDDVKNQIVTEKQRKDELLTEMNNLSTEIYEYQYNSKRLIKEMLAEFGAETVDQFALIFNDYARRNLELKNLKASLTQESLELTQKCMMLIPTMHCLADQYLHDCMQPKQPIPSACNEPKQMANTKLSVDQMVQTDQLDCMKYSSIPAPTVATAPAAPSEELQTRVNYKEMKYKKYLTTETANQQQPPLKISNKLNVDPVSTTTSDSINLTSSIQKSILEEKSQSGFDPEVADSQNGAVNNKSFVCNIDRINSIICQALQSDKESQPTQSTTNTASINFLATNEKRDAKSYDTAAVTPAVVETVTAKPKKTKGATGKRMRKSKFDSIKTKNDRQVILTNSAGCPTTQLVRTPAPSAMISSSNPVILPAAQVPVEKKFLPVKLKIKDNKVINLNSIGEEEISPVPVKDQSTRKRKQTNGTSHSNKRKASQRAANEQASKMDEPKLPPVVLKLATGNNGQWTPKNDDSIFDTKKSTNRTNHSEANVSNYTAKQSDRGSPPAIPTLKLSACQFAPHSFTANNDESYSNHSGKEATTNSPAIAFTSSRSSSIDSSTSFSVTTTGSAKKSRKSRSSKSQKVNGPPATSFDSTAADNFANPVSNVSSQPPSSDDISNYSNAMNLTNDTSMVQHLFPGNGPPPPQSLPPPPQSLPPPPHYLPNGLSTQNFDPTSFFQMNHNKTLKGSTESIHQKKLKESAKANAINSTTQNGSYYEVNSTPPINFPYHTMSSCMMDKATAVAAAAAAAAATTNATDLLDRHPSVLQSQTAYDYSTMNCRYENSASNFASFNIAPPGFDSVSKKSKNDPAQLNGNGGYYNQSVIF